jgi:(1->4)-alpha-D-glucan 1-alpha-D-glucosylmutase
MELRVYRTYVDSEGPARDEDVREIVATLARAHERRADVDPSLFEFLEQLWCGRLRGELEEELVMRLQQLTGPAMAKGAEDTACYVFNRLLSHNDVGGDPGTFAIEIDEFHRACLDTQVHWPETMLATSTHDTKRSEDVRARVSLLSEIPARWVDAVGRWSRANAAYWRGADPDRNAEYLLYQTLVGAWPIEPERVLAYMEKAAREAKTHTSWTDPDPEYESRLTEFVTSALADRAFVADLERFVAPLIEPGRINSLAQTLIKLTAPGIPDIYQGTELWDGSLVDPDNRRPVDFARRRRLLAELNHLQPAAIWARLDDGLPKLWVIRQALHLRDAEPQLFGRDGSYRPILARGAGARHVVAFARRERAVTIVPRLPITLGGSWDDTELDLGSGRWHDLLSGETHGGGVARLGRLLDTFPLALLVNEAP